MSIELTADKRTIVVTIPIDLRRTGARKQILAPANLLLSPSRPRPNETIIRALARAFHWRQQIETGVVHNARALAEREKMDPSFLARTLRLTLLAPDIIDAILDGRQPKELSLADLMKGFPEVWEDQKASLGFKTDS